MSVDEFWLAPHVRSSKARSMVSNEVLFFFGRVDVVESKWKIKIHLYVLTLTNC